MADHTAIEWTDATWNPLRGCSRVSVGCEHCYAECVAARFSGVGQPYAGLIHPSTKGWNGKITLVPEALQIPWRWSRGRRIFVNSMSDLFHPEVPFEFIAAVFWVMAHTTRHTYQVLTKRPERALEFFRWAMDQYDIELGCEPGEAQMRFPEGHEQRGWAISDGIDYAAHKIPAIKALGWEPWREGKKHGGYDNCGPGWPLQNVWLGVSVENQAAADERISQLLQCPAAVRWLSCEPLLGPINFRWAPYAHLAKGQSYRQALEANGSANEYDALRKIDWVVVGGESGAGARPMHPEWAESLRDQCAGASVPFFFKQWGEWAPIYYVDECGRPLIHFSSTKNETVMGDPMRPSSIVNMERCGKRKAGRLLDGVEHNSYPASAP
jgi:protein gp37